ncbi:hypothetical protein FA95DRAFT_1552191 [Auriscalpium vulgare]|uniref:Uncharacterized protein n=1 Tax=Auriscalpium vulgare TaxID=40419 RepID=A0ACB8SCR0_9AGAM|nr:hypothetical protein FA95DRAFT_1552191 [Auriscalpium vulgare]
MVEPFLASVNGLLSSSATSSRSLLAVRSSMHPVLQKLASQDVVSSHFKRLKGKEKAQPESDWIQHSGWQCEPHGSACRCANSNALHSPRHPPRRHPAAAYAMQPRTHSSHQPPQTPYGMQIRHASSSAQYVTKASPRTDAYQIVDRFVQGDPLPGQLQPVPLDLAWDSYSELRERDAPMSTRLDALLPFIDRALSALEQARPTQDELDKWTVRFRHLLEGADAVAIPRSSEEVHRMCLWARVGALSGDVPGATKTFSQMHEIRGTGPPLPFELRTYESMFQALYRARGPVAVLDFIVSYWQTVGRCLEDHHFRGHEDADVLSVRDAAFRLLQEIELPAAVLAGRRERDDKTSRLRMADVLVTQLIANRIPEDALDICKEMDRQGLPVRFFLQLSLVRSLVRAKAFELANTLFSGLSSDAFQKEINDDKQTFYATGLHLFAQQGEVKRAEEMFASLEKIKNVGRADIGMRLQAHAVGGDTATVVRLFYNYFPNDRKSRHKPTIQHYTAVIMAHARNRDLDGMNEWLEKMSKRGFTPDRHVFDVIVTSFASRGEVDIVAMVLEQMRRAGLPPQVVTYTNIITMLAARRDPVAAESIYRRAISEGVRPDRQMIAALMGAHAEAGSWKGVIRAFDYMRSSRNRQYRPRIDVYNILLKAYVLLGAPFKVVADVFEKIEDTGVRPTLHTFSLLIQSACDSGLMDVATNVFRELDTLSQQWETGLQVNAYALTIIMAGYLRQGNKYKAKEVYDDMLARGIQPTSITFGAILNAYANDGSQESIELAQEFLASLMAKDPGTRTWLDPSHRRRSGYEHLYGPLMTLFSRNAQPEEVEKYFQEILDAGGEPSLLTLTLLLHAYRRVGNVDTVRELWAQILDLGKRSHHVDLLFEGFDEPPRKDLQRKTNILCLSLSIYMDSLSSAGFHDEIAQTWNELKQLGFAFDSHNWNHLVVVLIRAGRPLHAFQILERVILPYQEKSQHIIAERSDSPPSPLTFEDAAPLEDEDPDAVEPAPPIMNFSPIRRAQTVAIAELHAKGDLNPPPEREDDFAHPLHILHQISPSWNLWRPHAAVVRLLSSVLEHLLTGRAIQPVLPLGAVRPPPQPDEEDEAHVAKRALREIHEQCPKAVEVVKAFSFRLRAREQRQEMIENPEDRH